MDREQAIEIIERHIDNNIASGSLVEQALSMAIEALKAQLSKEGTTKDAIDRQAAIEKFTMTAPQMSVIRIYEAVEILESMPPAQPEPQWIPVEKELPEPRIDVWVNSDLGQMVGYYDEMVNLWYGRDYLELIVNAWMPLPEAYKPNNK